MNEYVLGQPEAVANQPLMEERRDWTMEGPVLPPVLPLPHEGVVYAWYNPASWFDAEEEPRRPAESAPITQTYNVTEFGKGYTGDKKGNFQQGSRVKIDGKTYHVVGGNLHETNE